MDPEQLKMRTKEFAKQVIFLCRQLPDNREAGFIGGHLFRSGTSVGANYRAARKARSKADFISKLGIVLEEADEALYWLEILLETNIAQANLLSGIMAEANELVAIFVSSLNTAKRK